MSTAIPVPAVKQSRSRVSPESRTQAIQMRATGASYPDIVTAINCEAVTLDWCKRNLKTVPVYDTHFYLVEELTPLALRPEGVARLDLRTRIKKAYGIADGSPIPRAIYTRTTNALPEGSFIRPDFLEPEAAAASQNALCGAAVILMERFEELVADYLHQFPSTSPWHVRNTILQMLTGSHPGGPLVQGRRINDAVDELADRVPQKDVVVSFAAPVAAPEYDALCV